MSEDKMSSTFVHTFDFKAGEQSTAEKLTGFVKHVDIAFTGIAQAIGDPWDSKVHSFELSLENLGITSLARIIGPSDYVSPLGGCFNEVAEAVTVQLQAGKNSWNLGYPLVKAVNLQEWGNGSFSPLEWGTDIQVSGGTDPSGLLTTEVDSLEEIHADGDFYVDYNKGTITAYGRHSSTDIILLITGMYFYGAGVPWGTHNVIPAWNQTTSLCTVAKVIDEATTTTWTLALPLVTNSPRVIHIGNRIGGSRDSDPDSIWNRSIPGYRSYYRLPRAVTSAGLSVDAPIPGGYLQLWEETTGRIVPNVLFYYTDENNLKLVTPYSASGYLVEGSNYRLLASGTSLSEAVSYLFATQRYNKHAGLTETANAAYTVPLSHDDLENLHAGNLSNIGTINVTAFKFRRSSYATNPHPQYIHRAGYMEDDRAGNSCNAMRGNLVFASEDDWGYLCNQGTSGGNMVNTYGLQWGGGDTSAEYRNTTLAFEGGKSLSSWSVGSAAVRTPFGLMGVGAIPADSVVNERFGALSYRPWYGTPLYLRGMTNDGPTNSGNYKGAVLGFDWGNRSEANYLKLYPALRASPYFDESHLAANTGQTSFSEVSPAMPNTSNRVSASQVRELRFRGVPLVESAVNVTESLGGAITRAGADPIEEFAYYFTSPGILGADFFNVYSNAIFFSDTGDGKATGFTTGGADWLNNTTGEYDTDYGYFSQYMPTGVYYFPYSTTDSYSQKLVFSVYDSTLTYSTQPLHFGDRAGFSYLSAIGGDILTATLANGEIAIIAGATAFAAYSAGATSNKISILSDSMAWIDSPETTVSGENSLVLTSGTGSILVDAKTTLDLDAEGNIGIESSAGNVSVNATNITLTSNSSGLITLNSSGNTVINSAAGGYFHTIDIAHIKSASSYVKLESTNSYIDLSASAQIQLVSTNSFVKLQSKDSSNYFTLTGGGDAASALLNIQDDQSTNSWMRLYTDSISEFHGYSGVKIQSTSGDITLDSGTKVATDRTGVFIDITGLTVTTQNYLIIDSTGEIKIGPTYSP